MKIIFLQTLVQLTNSASGHTLHNNGVFSLDGQWLVFDGRNYETKIGETSVIGIVNVKTGKERAIYNTKNPTIFGPGVGAASFNPVMDRVVFIHGLLSASESEPYAMTRRTGVAVDLGRPQEPIFLDARDISAPYAAGSLRGGTHGHCWSPDGKMLSYTYNDEFVNPDLRTVGVMIPNASSIHTEEGKGNNDGCMYAAVIAQVVANPIKGSDEINKAFDECWVGRDGYINACGDRISHAIAFQGNTLDNDGNVITEIFIVDVDITKIADDVSAVGKIGERPHVPAGITQRRLTNSAGFSNLRYWLRSSLDGKYIFALAKDQHERNQIAQCDVITGEMILLTTGEFGVNSPFNLSSDGRLFVFISGNNIIVYDRIQNKYNKLTENTTDGARIVGTPSFSPADDYVVFTQYVDDVHGQPFLQIYVRNID